MGFDLLYVSPRRRALYRHAGRRQPGQARRHDARANRPDRGDVGVSPSAPRRRVTRRLAMLQVKRIGHATLTTPDLERQFDYDTRVVGLTAVATEKKRAILATKPGQAAI